MKLRIKMALRVDISKFKTAEFKEKASGLIQAFYEVKTNTLSMYQFLQDEANNTRFDGFYGIDDVYDIIPTTSSTSTRHKMRFFSLISDFAMTVFENDSFSVSTNRYIHFTQDYFKYLTADNKDFNTTTYGGNLGALQRAFSDVASISGCFAYFLRHIPDECWTEPVVLPDYNDNEPGLMRVRPYLRKFKPKGIYRIRQLLSKIRHSELYQQYLAYINHADDCEDPDECEICSNPVYLEDLFTELAEEFPAECEIADTSRDMTLSATDSSKYISDPLILRAWGLFPIDGVKTAKDEYFKRAFGVVLGRKYITKPYYLYYDYAEANSSITAFTTGGNPNYLLSNIRSWLNSTSTKAGGWAVPTHDTDVLPSVATYSLGYLAQISDNLRRHLAKITLITRIPVNNNTSKPKTCTDEISEEWAWLPTLGDVGVSQLVKYRHFTTSAGVTVEITGDADSYWPNGTGTGSIGYMLERADWHRPLNNTAARKMSVNPELSTTVADNAQYYLTRTASYNPKTEDMALVTSQIASIKGTTGGLASSSPYGSRCVAPQHLVVEFHADKSIGVPKAKCNGPTLT